MNKENTIKSISSSFYYFGDMELVKNIYEYFNIQDEDYHYTRWFEKCIKKYNLVENEDYFTFKSRFDDFEELDYILIYSEKSYNLIDSLNLELIKEQNDD